MLLSSPLTACTGVQSALDPAGEEATSVATLFFAMLVGGAIIWIAMIALFLYAGGKKKAHSEKQSARLILWGGAVFPCILLGALLTYAVWLMPNVRPFFRSENGGAARIEVVGEQFWWRVRYLDPKGGVLFETANEVRIPVGERVSLVLKAADVIHSFWIPVLAGKMDMIPGRDNPLTLLAHKPGSYRGVCAEFCGTSHALMAFSVEVMEPDAFARWLERRQASSGTASGEGADGLTLFTKHGCSACHAISGTSARGEIGPNLTAFGERGSVGAGTLGNEVEHIARFLRDPDAVKPGAKMPHFTMIPPTEADSIARYLKGLQ